MGRRKVELKPIEDKSSRQVMFSKRRSGLIKKARELSILCDVEIALFVFSGRGRLYEFRTGDSLRRILDRYQNHKDADVAGRNVKESEKLCEGCEDLMKATNLLKMVQRLFEQHKVEQLDVTELIQLEHKLDAIQRQTRIRKSQLMMKSVMALHEKRRQFRVEKTLVEKEFTATSAATTTKTTADYHSRRLTHHHQLQLQDPIVNQELYAYANTNQSTGPVPPLQQQESTSYYLP